MYATSASYMSCVVALSHFCRRAASRAGHASDLQVKHFTQISPIRLKKLNEAEIFNDVHMKFLRQIIKSMSNKKIIHTENENAHNVRT
jgi:hypothetical protein